MAGHHKDGKATLFFGLLLLLFLQTLSVWLESIYKIGLTRLSMGPEALALCVAVAPLVLLAAPKHAGPGWMRAALSLFLAGRGLLPWVGVQWGAWAGTCAVGAFLVALCFLLTGPYRYWRGEPGYALGLALLGSMALRIWGTKTDARAPVYASRGWTWLAGERPL